MFGSLGGVALDLEPSTPASHAKLSDLRKEWDNSYRSTGRLPGRHDFPARRLMPWLPHIAIVSVIGEEPRFQIRLMGAACVQYAQGDYTGRYIDECVAPDERLRVLEPYYACFFTKQPVQRNKIYVRKGESRLLTYRLYLPLATDGENVDSILVCVLGF